MEPAVAIQGWEQSVLPTLPKTSKKENFSNQLQTNCWLVVIFFYFEMSMTEIISKKNHKHLQLYEFQTSETDGRPHFQFQAELASRSGFTSGACDL